MGVIPQFGGDPDVFSLDNARLKRFCKGLTNFCLVAVDAGTVNMAIANPQGRLNRFVNLTGLRLPGAQAKYGHGVTVAELQCLHRLSRWFGYTIP